MLLLRITKKFRKDRTFGKIIYVRKAGIAYPDDGHEPRDPQLLQAAANREQLRDNFLRVVMPPALTVWRARAWAMRFHVCCGWVSTHRGLRAAALLNASSPPRSNACHGSSR